MDGRGNVLIPLDEAAVRALAPKLKAAGIEAIAIGYMHAYLDGKHERRTRDILTELLPGVSISLSSEVSPEIREYERWSTAVANAYVQPVMDRYLGRLDEALRKQGVACPLFMITSGGGLAALETARKFPIRLVEVGPGRRRHPGGGAGAAVRPRQGAVVRHGRHDRQDLPDRQRRAAAFAHLRGRAAVPLPQGQRPAAAHPGDRDGRDRRRRRLDRLGRFAVARQCRPGERRRRARPGELRPRRHRAHRDRCRRRAGPHRSRLLRRRLDQALARQGGRRRRQGGRHAARPEAPRRGVRRQRDRRGEHGQRRPRPCRRARQGAAGPHHDRLRRRRAASMPRGWPRSSASAASWCRAARASARPSAS